MLGELQGDSCKIIAFITMGVQDVLKLMVDSKIEGPAPSCGSNN